MNKLLVFAGIVVWFVCGYFGAGYARSEEQAWLDAFVKPASMTTKSLEYDIRRSEVNVKFCGLTGPFCLAYGLLISPYPPTFERLH